MRNVFKCTEAISSVKYTATFLCCASIWIFTPELALAAITFGDIGLNIAENAKGIAKGITMGGYAAGMFMAVWGTIEMFKAGKRQGESTYAGGVTKIVIGALALGVGEVLGSGSATLFGTDQTTGLGELGL